MNAMKNAVKNLLLAVFVSIVLTACGSEQQYPPLPKDATVLILGNSLTYGTGAAAGQDYPSRLATSTGWNIINAGIPGDTSEGGLARLPDLLDEYEIDLLIVELGGNDFLKRIPQEQTRENLKTILAEARANSVQTLLLAIPAFSPLGAAVGRLSDHDLYSELAQETGTPLVTDLFSHVLGNHEFKADPIHPNAEGYRIVEENLRKSLIQQGFLK